MFRARHSVTLACAVLAGCFSPEFQSGQLACDETQRCPPGLECDTATDRCVLPGGAADATPELPDADPSAPDADPTAPDAAPASPIRLNINGPEVVGTDFPGTWTADPGSSAFCTGSTGTLPASVTGTVDQELFRYRVFGDVVCSVGSDLPAGEYEVTLLMGELYFGPGCPGGGAGTGARVFDIRLEGATREQSVDVFVEGGCMNSAATTPGMPVLRTFDVRVDDGALDIELPNGQVSAIRVLPL